MTLTSESSIPQVERLDLAAIGNAVAIARKFTTNTLMRWGVGHELIDTAELVMSELATNAVKSTGYLENKLGWDDLSQLVRIKLRLVLRESLFIEVWDSEAEAPVLKDQSENEQLPESGRGLQLVAMLTTRWGYYYSKGGKVVWGEVGV